MDEPKSTNKAGLIGTGMVGASFAYSLMQRGLANELVLIDMDTARAEGEAMDLNLPLSPRELAAFQGSAQTLKDRLIELG